MAASLAGDVLPVLKFTRKNFYRTLPAQWANVQVLDCDLLDVAEPHTPNLPALRVLRRAAANRAAPDAPAIVDMIRFPGVHGGMPELPNVSVKRHVIVYAYDPRWIVGRRVYDIDKCVARWDGEEILILRRRPDTLEANEGAATQEEPGAREDAEATGVAGTQEATTDDDDDLSTSFLCDPLWRAAERRHRFFTYVGLEALPPAVLARYGFDDAELALANSDSDSAKDEWAATVRTRITEHILDLAAKVDVLRGYAIDWSETAWPANVEDSFEVLTLDEYRKRVGEEMFGIETYADCEEMLWS